MHAVTTDQRVPHTAGIELLMRLHGQCSEGVDVIGSGFTDIAGFNEAGVHPYVTKPRHPEVLLLSVRNAVWLHGLQHENARCPQQLLRLNSVGLRSKLVS
ncbi:MAG: hypothetical protein P8Y78_12430 [Acidihalobacter sp.]